MAENSKREAGLWSRIVGSPRTNAAIFAVATGAGCIYILTAKLNEISAFWVTFGPVLIMMAYAGLIGMARALRLRDDQSGDNLYYMGFLFTLTSLGVSLFQFNANGAAEQIVQNFGVAIASTIAGIALRVFFNQMRRDPLEVEAAARSELADAARRVRRDLDGLVLEISHFRRSAQQTVLDGFEETRQKVDEVAESIMSGLKDVAARSAEPLEEVTRQSGSALDALSSSMVERLKDSASHLSAETDRLTKGASAVAESLDQISAKLSSMQTPDQVIEVKLAPMIQGLTKAVNAFGKNTESQSLAMTQAIETARATSESAAMLVAALQKDLEARDVALGRSLNAVQEAAAAASSAAEGAQQAAGQNAGLLDAIGRRVDEMIGSISEMLVPRPEAPSKPEA
ncbi:MAG: hypothetical protein DI565_16025 [Ancylobacter novellus]|uniref:Transmembrane protein n=1 Tax=Ancylobacter novellus TaxID=921 RepID=A0A2W5KA69_ANCNO|nr:MAG: hypothetical protein DI565_16025 [Ancylobacter novellus]